MPIGERRPPARRVRPAEIRRRGFAWPPAGVAASAYPAESDGCVDLDAVLRDLQASLLRWQRELRAAREMSARASRESYEAYDGLATGREDLGSRIATIQGAISEVERLQVHVERHAGRATNRRRMFLGIYVAVALVGCVVHAWARQQMPAELPRVAWSSDLTEVQASALAEETREQVRALLPASTRWLAPGALFWVDDSIRSLASPGPWLRENTTLRERVAAVNQNIDDIPTCYRDSATLLLVIFGVGLLLGFFALVRPSVVVALLMSLAPLFATPIATEPLINLDNPYLFYWTLPMLLAGLGFLGLQVVRAMKTGLAGRRGDHWLEVWVGAGLVVLGTGVTIGGILLATEIPGVAVLTTAVVPALYGLYLVGRGIWGLIRPVLFPGPR